MLYCSTQMLFFWSFERTHNHSVSMSDVLQFLFHLQDHQGEICGRKGWEISTTRVWTPSSSAASANRTDICAAVLISVTDVTVTEQHKSLWQQQQQHVGCDDFFEILTVKDMDPAARLNRRWLTLTQSDPGGHWRPLEATDSTQLQVIPPPQEPESDC